MREHRERISLYAGVLQMMAEEMREIEADDLTGYDLLRQCREALNGVAAELIVHGGGR